LNVFFPEVSDVSGNSDGFCRRLDKDEEARCVAVDKLRTERSDPVSIVTRPMNFVTVQECMTELVEGGSFRRSIPSKDASEYTGGPSRFLVSIFFREKNESDVIHKGLSQNTLNSSLALLPGFLPFHFLPCARKDANTEVMT
jgi:hypothetical protein